MARLVLPRDAYDPLAHLLHLSPDKRRELAECLRATPLAFLPDELAEHVAHCLSTDREAASEIVEFLATLFSARQSGQVTAERFAKKLKAAAFRTADERLIDESIWESASPFFVEVLGGDSLAVVAKAHSVMTDHDANFLSARILTGLRPIFSSDAAQDPAAGVLIHTLRITYWSQSERQDFYVALDSSDLKKLGAVVKRAEQKDATLRAAFHRSGFPTVVDPPADD